MHCTGRSGSDTKPETHTTFFHIKEGPQDKQPHSFQDKTPASTFSNSAHVQTRRTILSTAHCDFVSSCLTVGNTRPTDSHAHKPSTFVHLQLSRTRTHSFSACVPLMLWLLGRSFLQNVSPLLNREANLFQRRTLSPAGAS